MTKREELRKKILNKFRTLTNFSKVANIPYKRLMSIINADNDDSVKIKSVIELCDNTKENKDGLILNKDRKVIRICILTSFKDYTAFSNENPAFDVVYVSNIITGRLIEESNKYKDFIELLTNKYNLDNSILKRINNL